MAVNPTDRFARNEDVVTREILGQTLLVPISVELADMDNIFTLNETGAHVWHRLDGALTLAGISEAVVDSFEVSEAQAWDDLNALVDDLAAAGLICKVE